MTPPSSYPDPSVDKDQEVVRFIYEGWIVKEATYPVGTTISLRDAPFNTKGKEGLFVRWEAKSSSGETTYLNDHVILNDGGSFIVFEGIDTPFDNSVSGEKDRKLQSDGTVKGTPIETWQTNYQEDLDLGNQYIGSPDNLVSLNSFGINKNLTANIKAVSGTFTEDGTITGTYVDRAEVSQNSNQNISDGNSVHTMLNEDGSFFGRSESESSKKPVSYNGDTTIGLERTLSDSSESNYKPFQNKFDYAVNPDDQTEGTTNYVVTRITLQRDLVFTGDLILGGITGFYGNNADFHQYDMQGFIIGSYTELDLNGHDIIFADGGKLESYGSIVDTSKNHSGMIVMESGSSLETPVVLEDFQRPEGMANLYISALAPFTSYREPYLNANVRFKPGSELIWNMKFDTAGRANSGVINLDIPVIGDSSSSKNPIIEFSSKDEKEAWIDRKVSWDSIPEMTDFEKGNIVNQHFTYEAHNAELKYSGLSFQTKFLGIIQAMLDLKRTPFFIPHYYSFKMYDSDLILNSTLIFMPGSYLYSDAGSSVALTCDEMRQADEIPMAMDASDYQSVGGLIFMDIVPTGNNELVPVNYGDFHKNTINSQIFYNNEPAKFDCEGDLKFDYETSKDQLHQYQLGGNINIKDLSRFEENLSSAVNAGADLRLYGSSALGQSYVDTVSLLSAKKDISNTAVAINSYLNIPLISDGKVLLNPLEPNKVADEPGTWNSLERIVSFNDVSYAFFLDDYGFADNINLSCYVKDGNKNSTDSLDGSYIRIDMSKADQRIYSPMGESDLYINYRGIFIPVSTLDTFDQDYIDGVLTSTNKAESLSCFIGSTNKNKSTVHSFSRKTAYTGNPSLLSWEW